ncbi:E3 ubiquitin-protein ligase LRSAM1 isoform X2 [Eurytemora carolleeae]|nr:E3 ubiquitin-protein ligase LRSAM1 isoform X2 [Eurytemora carolleeae]|eukprot:XP_023336476.1 E3 ubiquitin-protein ligase LRSAM1-like isoform X2 [Eurytemora affinis]
MGKGEGICASKHSEDPGGSGDMQFWKKDKDGEKSKEKINYRSRLEHKQYLAQESPEPVYDLSECGLKNVPSGVFSRCKVLRKQALLLQDNELTQLNGGGILSDLGCISVLDLHNNCLEKLPEEIGTLNSLTTLNLENNKLKQLPISLGSLKQLRTLNLSGNCLKELPTSLSSLSNLTTLDLRNNPKLKKIPVEFSGFRCLVNLLLDPKHISYPSSDIVNQGTEAIMRFLCKECDIEYIDPSECLPIQANGESKPAPPLDPYQDIVTSHLAKAEMIKEQKRKQFALLEQQKNESSAAEIRLKEQNMENKKKLLQDLAQEESKKDESMKKLQKEKDEERSQLFSKMSSAEKQTDVLISELITSESRYSDPQKVMEALVKDKEEMEKLFTIHQQDVDKLKEKEVLRSMQQMMENELQKEMTRRQYEARQGIVQDALKSSLENDKAVESALTSKGKHQDELIGKLLEDEKYQREMFQSLLLNQDQRVQEISGQMDLIQKELATLTMVEMKKRDLKVEFELEVLKDKRETLTQLLLDLIQKKKERADDLQDLLGEIEAGKLETQENYWLIQYQKLMESKPAGVQTMEGELDPQVRRVLAGAGAEKLIPIFARKKVTFKELSFADHVTLRQYGVDSEYTRNQILSAVETMLISQNGSTAPSAPEPILDDSVPSAPVDDSAPSAPISNIIETFHTGECVVCMERKSEIIFLPCGHFCSCSNCEQSIDACPLCRNPVLQRVRLG